MNRPRKSKQPTEPRRTAAISTGQFVSGSLFRLVREIRGSAYSVGDQFMLLDEADCHDPNILKLGGVGETFFTDPAGNPLKIEAGDKQIDSIFEYVETPFQPVLEETEEVLPPEPQPEQVVQEVAVVTVPAAGAKGERGERGPRGFTGVQGDRGPKGDRGATGESGAVGPQGETGPKGDTGEKGEPGERGATGEKGDRGDRGPKGDRGERGERGEKGERGERGEKGAKGDKGDAGKRGERGEKGERGSTGPVGPRGAKGESGTVGKPGVDGKKGERGAKGDKGDRGATGESGLVKAEFPLVYDADDKSIRIDEQRLDRILKRILSGRTVSPADMGWFASTGGGGKVSILWNGTAITPDVRGINFKGAGVESVTKRGGRVTVNIVGGGGGISGDYVRTFNGLSGDVTGVSQITAGTAISVSASTGSVTISNTGVQQIIAGSNITVSGSTGSVTISSTASGGSGGGTNFFYQETPPVSGVTVGSRWMDSENGQEYIYINDGNSDQWVQPSIPSIISPTINTVVGYTGAAYSATQLDYYIGISYAGKVTVTLPDTPEQGREIIVKDESGNAGKGPNRAITVIGSDGDPIDNRASVIINIDNAGLHLIYRNGWRIV